MRETLFQVEDWGARLDALYWLQLNGEASEADNCELMAILETTPHAYERYVELAIDASNLRRLSDANVVRNPEPVETESVATTRHATMQSAKGGPYGVGFWVLAICLLLVVGTQWLRPTTDEMPGQLSSARGAASDDTKSMVSPLPAVAASTEDLPRDPQIAARVSHGKQEVATVLRVDDVVWANSFNANELSRVAVGETLHLVKGELELIFDRAVRMRVRGPAVFEIRSPTEVYGRYGVYSALVGDAGKGFVIETPSGRIVDLGTEFGVAIDQSGSTDVAVFRGAVDLTYGPWDNLLEASMTRRVVQGQALTLKGDGTMKRLVSFDDSRFPSFRFEAPPRPLPNNGILTHVADNISDRINAKSYRIVREGLREDALAYVDRQHEWNGVDGSGLPEVLRGADYVLPFNQDKYLRDLEVSVSVGQPARLYIFMSPLAGVPEWISDTFEKTEMRIGLDEAPVFVNPHGKPFDRSGYSLSRGAGASIDTEFEVWQQDIAMPTTVPLGSVRQVRRGWGFCMYGIAAVPLDVAQRFDAAE